VSVCDVNQLVQS